MEEYIPDKTLNKFQEELSKIKISNKPKKECKLMIIRCSMNAWEECKSFNKVRI